MDQTADRARGVPDQTVFSDGSRSLTDMPHRRSPATGQAAESTTFASKGSVMTAAVDHAAFGCSAESVPV